MMTEQDFMPRQISAAKKAMSVLYPKPNTMAQRILDYIRANPGTTTNGIISGMELNASPTRTCIKNLLDRGKIRCVHQDNGRICPLSLHRDDAAKLRAQIGQSEHQFMAGKVDW